MQALLNISANHEDRTAFIRWAKRERGKKEEDLTMEDYTAWLIRSMPKMK